MKLTTKSLLALYVNIFSVILLLISLFNALLAGTISWFQWLSLGLTIISGIFYSIYGVKTITNAYRLYKNSEYNLLRKNMKALKLWLIPYFIINFVIYLFLFMILFAASRGIIVFSPIPLLFLLPIFHTYLTVLFTSSYSLGFIAIIKKEKGLKLSSLIIYVLLQLCFVLDVIGTIILLAKYKAE